MVKKKHMNQNFKSMAIAVGVIVFSSVVCVGVFLSINSFSKAPENSPSALVNNQINKNELSNQNAHTMSEPGVDDAMPVNKQLNSKISEAPVEKRKDASVEKSFKIAPDFSVNTIDTIDIKELFKDSVINKNTLTVTDMLQVKFSNSEDDIDVHLDAVEMYLRTQLDDDVKIEEYLDFYKKYSEYQSDLVSNNDPFMLETPENPEEAILLNADKMEYKRDVFGEAVTDTLWGEESNNLEYRMKELKILQEETYSILEKEQLIEELRGEMFTGEGSQQGLDYSSKLYIRLAANGEELLEMTDEERNAKIQAYKMEILPPEQLKFLEFFEGAVDTAPDETKNLEKD